MKTNMIPFTHLHVHSQYSILDGAASISGLVEKAKNDGMKSLALTDHGTMFGIKDFYDTCRKNDMKPILGCETYVAARGIEQKSEKVDRSGDHLILLAKNLEGYKNLLRLISIASCDGMYYKPRIDKSLLEKYHKGLIVSSACLGGEIPQRIMQGDLAGAEAAILWFKNLFGADYYLELQRHKTTDPLCPHDVYERQIEVNKVLIELAKKYNIKLIATNDVHFTNEEDADAHDLLICLNTGKDLDDPTRMRYTKQEWFKTTAEMNELFSDVPEALADTQEIVDKIEEYELDSKPIMPDFPLPDGFTDNAEYLKYLTYEGAKKRYGDPIPTEAKERIDFELETIVGMGFPGYFLIVQDFINAARNMGVLVGPGRGSAAGAAVSYCIGITNIDPIKHDLLFERFLNPDRISMPDVDIDFDDDGRQLVLEWVTKKYGQDKVSHIVTFGTMAAKLAIRDVARVLKLPLSEADRLAKMVPDAPKMTLKKAYKENPELEKEKNSDNELVRKTIRFAEILEGSVRQTGIHACGILISKDPLYDHIPVMPTKGESLLTTQYDGHFVEPIGLLKMDFLGLKTLSIIKECLDNINLSRGKLIDMDKIPLDDEQTYQLFSNGDTTAIFQFESPGMKKYLRGLHPNRFEDLVAMNALYRPGPMEYIPKFIERKNGLSPIVYDHPMMEPYLKDTCGITVYQEQVMLQSRALGGFTRGESDTLRKAMGKKNFGMMNKLKIKFHDGCRNNKGFMSGCLEVKKNPDELIDKIWKDWESFASYAFNKSHSVCYAYVAYQTGYLKAHYPAEYMAAVLSRNLSNSEKITTFMDECQHMDMDVLGPDVNESYHKFTVNKEGAIRFGMGGIKGVGEGAVSDIITEREKRGPFKDIYDFIERVNLQSVNKKNIEALAIAGAFDGFNVYRSQFFAGEGAESSFLENLIRYGHKIQQERATAQQSLFGGEMSNTMIQKPVLPSVPEWPKLMLLEKEKALIGIYLSAHPLDDYKFELEHFTTEGIVLAKLLPEDLVNEKGREISVGGMVIEAREAMTKTGKPFSVMTLGDYSGSHQFYFFGQDFVKFANYCKTGLFLLVHGKVVSRFGNSDQLEFKLDQIDLLSTVRNAKVKNITLEMPLYNVTEDFVNNLNKEVSVNKGDAVVRFNIWDAENNIMINLFSRNTRVELTNSLLDFLQNQEDLVLKIN